MTLPQPVGDVRALPKAELHCHLDGILSPAMAHDIRAEDPTFPVDPAALAGARFDDMASFFGWWDHTRALDGRLSLFTPILRRHIAQLKAQRVVYAELMIASGEVPADDVQAVEEVGALRAWTDAQEDGEIQVEYLVAFGRNKPPEEIERRARRLLRLAEAGLIVGAALAGPEPGWPVAPLRRTLAMLKEAGLGIEIHAGEWSGPDSVWDALRHGSPDRIGHGISLFEDTALLDLFRERQIHIEMCPTSNVMTGAVAGIDQHPIRRARDLGLNFSVNTDDPGPFGCSMEGEYRLLAETFGFSERDLRDMFDRALAARFQPVLRVALPAG